MESDRQCFRVPVPAVRRDRGAIRFRLLAVALLAVLSAAGPLACRSFSPEAKSEREARRMAQSILEAMGGRRALNRLHYLRYDFVVLEGNQEKVRRFHLWDRATGRYRMEWKEKGGVPVVVYMNVNTRQGRAVVGFHNEAAPDPQPWVDKAYANYINDMDWLMAATKLLDKGTHLKYEGEKELDGRRGAVLYRWCDPGVGLTPKDRFWFYIDPQTHLPFAWSFILNGADVPPTTYLWTQWQKVGNMQFPVRFDKLGGGRTILIENLFAPFEILEPDNRGAEL